jgi:hypothetical protein
MLRDPRSTKYIYNLQIIAPPNNADNGRHIVIGTDTKNNLKLGYDIDNAWINSNGPLKILSKNNKFNIGSNLNIDGNTFSSKFDNIQNLDKNNIGYMWQGNTINFNSNLDIKSDGPIKLSNKLLLPGGKSNVNTMLPNDLGINILSGDTNIIGNVNADSIKSNTDLFVFGNTILKGGKNNEKTLLPNDSGINILSGDTNINGKLNTTENIYTSQNITSSSLNVAGKIITTNLQVDGSSLFRGIVNTDYTVLKGGNSEYNINNLQTYFSAQNDNKNYIRGDTEITGNLNLPGNIQVGKNININGSLNIVGQLNKNGTELLPSGVICMWSGNISTIPNGWLLCDGSNGTPDLRSRFIIGASLNKPPDKTLYTYGSLGGNESIILTSSNLPPHSHSLIIDRPLLDHNCWKGGDCGGPNLVKSGTWSGETSITGSGLPFNILPPYYALAFIMKK